MLRSLSFLACLTLGLTSSFAQSDLSAEEKKVVGSSHIQEALLDLSARVAEKRKFGLLVTGEEWTGKIRSDIRIEAFWNPVTLNGAEVDRFDISWFRNNELQNVIIADGARLWQYRPLRNEYSCLSLDERVGGSTTTMLDRMLQVLDREARIRSPYALALLKDFFLVGRMGKTWNAWFSWPVFDLDGDDVVVDQDSRAGFKSSQEMRVSLLAPNPALERPHWRLTAASYASESVVAGERRSVSWTATPIIDFDASGLFSFTPPAKAKSVAMPSARG